ncbi:MAG: FGGY-family carbohydrate kinase [Deltaproteobacteria bacterium]|nr:FGGY-family carbohydrate kinase [Deltaproteobacteria bacterium]MBT4525980.1 FGGY-family carbohydrate kinase [Deltaproteobacteria bacterium]
MKERFLLGIDIGTSGCKLAVFDAQGNVKAFYNQTYQTDYPGPGYAEQDANDWWRAVTRGLLNIFASTKVNPHDITAIGLAGQSPTCLPVDKNGSPLRKALIWLDTRSVEQIRKMTQLISEDEIIQVSGNPVATPYIIPKIKWIEDNEPEIFRATHHILQSHAFIGHQLTGHFYQDMSTCNGYHIFNISKGKIDFDMAEKLQVPISLVPEIVSSHQIIGEVTQEASKITGLPKGIPVVAGGLDAACGTLGAGVFNAGQTQEQGGQAGGMSIVTPNALIHPKLILSNHVVPQRWLLQGGTTGGGGVLKWLREQFFENIQAPDDLNTDNPFEIMSYLASKSSPGSKGLVFLPYMSGERSPLWDPRAKGTFVGLNFQTEKTDIIRSVMEGVAYTLLHNLKTAQEVKAEINNLISVGGAANSVIWTQIKSDVTGKPIQVPFSDFATPLGAAILAGVGTGYFPSFEVAVNQTVKIQRYHEPDFKNHQIYRDYFGLFLELYDSLKEKFQKLDQIKTKTGP